MGDDDFVKLVSEDGERIPEVNLSIHKLNEAVCDLYNTNIESVRISGQGRQASNIRAISAILVQESGHLILEELAKVVDGDASSLSKHAARPTKKSIECEKLQQKISSVINFTSQMPECQA